MYLHIHTHTELRYPRTAPHECTDRHLIRFHMSSDAAASRIRAAVGVSTRTEHSHQDSNNGTKYKQQRTAHGNEPFIVRLVLARPTRRSLHRYEKITLCIPSVCTDALVALWRRFSTSARIMARLVGIRRRRSRVLTCF